MNVRRIHPFAGLALNEIHESRAGAAVNLCVGIGWTQCVGTLLRDSITGQAEMVIGLTVTSKRVKFFSKNCAVGDRAKLCTSNL